MSLMLPNIYKGDYRLLMVVPLVLLIAAIYFIPQIKMGIDFQGGTIITLSLPEPVNAEELEAQLQAEGLDAEVRVFDTAVGVRAEIEVPQSGDLLEAEQLKGRFNTLLPEVISLELSGYQNGTHSQEYLDKKAELDGIADEMFTLAGMRRQDLNISGTNDLQKRFTDAYSSVFSDYQESISAPIERHVRYDSISVQTVSPALSSHFIGVAINVVVLAIVLSLILVFLFFREFVPSVAVLTGAVSDIVLALGAMGLFGIPLTLGSFAALLMLLGFSLDTDILLTSRMLKRKGDPKDNAHDAMKTGLTMSMTAFVAFGSLLLLSVITHIPTFYDISAVALAGIVADMFATWCVNGVIILYYVEHKRRKEVAG